MRSGDAIGSVAAGALLLVVLAGASAPPARAQSGDGAQSGWSIEVSSGPPAVTIPPAVTAMRVSGDSRRARLELDLTRAVDVSLATLSEPERIVVDLPQVEFKVPGSAGQKGRGLIKAFRFGLLEVGQSRVVIDTAFPVRARSFESARPDGRGRRLVIELVPRESAGPSVAPAAPPAALPLLRREAVTLDTAPPVPARKTLPVIVIDPGHGGVDPGAVGAGGLLEKDVALSVSRHLMALLAATGRYALIMTRDRDVHVSLDQRVRISRRSGADLFLSIHADSVPEDSLAQMVRGGSVYTLSEKASDAQAHRLAEKENAADLLAGVEAAAPDDQDEVRGILFDLLRRETADFSADFRGLLAGELRKHIQLTREPQRSAAFKVLKQMHSPSVLVELGYMSNSEDERVLRSPDWQRRVAEAITAAINSYFSKRGTGLAHQP